MKNICLLIYDLRSGGAEKVISQWSILLSKEHKVYMTLFDQESELAYPYGGELIYLNGKANNKNIITKSKIVLQRANELTRFVKEKKIDIVISFCNECNLVNTISRHKAKKICSIRSASDLNSNIFVNLVVNSRNNQIIIQTEALKKSMVEKYGEWIEKKLLVFGNPFNTELIRKMAKEDSPSEIEDILKNKKTIVNVASFKPQKNHANLLKSFELIAKEVDDAVLLLVGADSVGRKACVEKMKSQSRYGDRIIFVGELKNPYSVVSRSSVFVLPSLAEGIPNVLAEAMICGTAVIACDCPTGPAELLCSNPKTNIFDDRGIIEADFGILTRPFSGESEYNYDSFSEENRAFANAVISVLSDTQYREKLRQKAICGAERFDISKYQEDLLHLIDDCL